MNPPRPRIAVLGSINMDLVVRCGHLPAPGETVIAESFAEIPGGKGANQAVSAARAGGDVTMFGRVGSDAFAGQLVRNLEAEGVRTQFVLAEADCPSGLAIVSVDERGENSIVVVPGANGRIRPGDVEAVAEKVAAADVLLLQLEIPLEAVLAAIGAAEKAGVRVILDPAPAPDFSSTSVPPKRVSATSNAAVSPQRTAAASPRSPSDSPTARTPGGSHGRGSGRLTESRPARVSELLEVDLIVPNQTEAAAIVGRPIGTVQEAFRCVPELHAAGARNVVVTLGGDGAVVSDGESADWIDPLPVVPIDSTAAGDAFAGALAVRWAEGASLHEAARFACAAGALAATREGAQPGMPSRTEIERMLE